LAAGLAAAGKLGVAHRDIKPSNVLLAWSGRPMLLDFNLSSGEDQAGDRVGGTLAYMAPERIELLLADRSASEERVDPLPDIFSLGVVLYELLSGRLPVQPQDAEASDAASMRRWLASRSQPIAPPSQFNRSVDAQVDRMVLKCLAVDPAKRYASAPALVRDLAAYLSPRQMAARWMRRNRRGVLLFSLGAGAALAAGSVYWSRLPPYHEAKYREGLQLYNAGDYRGAIQALNRSLEANPESVKALFARGQCYYRADDLQAAQNDYVAAAALEPRGLFWFCAACCGLQNDSGAVYLLKALEAGYNESHVRCNLGVFFDRHGPTSQALSNLDLAIDLDPNLQQAYVERAFVLHKAATKVGGPNRNQAIADIAMAEKLGPPSRRLFYLGAVLHEMAIDDLPGSLAEAERYFCLMRAVDNPKTNYKNGFTFQRLLQRRPKLADLEPDPAHTFVPDPASGIGPPATADLSQVVLP
jgi:tetratricopeptide (TPR) repeat protein